MGAPWGLWGDFERPLRLLGETLRILGDPEMVLKDFRGSWGSLEAFGGSWGVPEIFVGFWGGPRGFWGVL